MRYSYLQGTTSEGRMLWCHGGNVEEQNGKHLHYAHVFEGTLATPRLDGRDRVFDVASGLNSAYMQHNADDRPRGREIRSMSVGDVVVIEPESFEPDAIRGVWFCANVGWIELHGEAAADLRDIARRRAYGTIETKDVAGALTVED